MHDVTVPEAVNREHVQVPVTAIAAINLLETSQFHVLLKYLTNAVLSIAMIESFAWMKQVCIGFSHLAISLTDYSLFPEHALDLVSCVTR